MHLVSRLSNFVEHSLHSLNRALKQRQGQSTWSNRWTAAGKRSCDVSKKKAEMPIHREPRYLGVQLDGNENPRHRLTLGRRNSRIVGWNMVGAVPLLSEFCCVWNATIGDPQVGLPSLCEGFEGYVTWAHLIISNRRPRLSLQLPMICSSRALWPSTGAGTRGLRTVHEDARIVRRGFIFDLVFGG